MVRTSVDRSAISGTINEYAAPSPCADHLLSTWSQRKVGTLMQRLYVVALKTELVDASDGDTAFDRVISHMARHLVPGVTGLSSADLVAGAGETVVKSRNPEWADNHLSWRPILVDEHTRAVRLSIEHDLPAGGRFVCELTAAEHAGTTGFRVVLGRRSDGRVSPARVDELNPPRALLALMADKAMRCTDGPDLVESTVTNALTAQMGLVRERLEDPERRLPILAVSAMRLNGASVAFARRAAERLVGLAHVVVISGQLALDAFNRGHGDEHRLFRDGARLYWPDLNARSRWWDTAALHGNHDELLTRITRTITPLTVLARGRDELWDAVRAADADTALDDLAESEGARNAALRAKIAEVNALNLELLEENEQLEQQIRSLQVELENREVQQAYAAPAQTELEVATATPTPTRDFTEQWERWEAKSEGALVFTDRAKSTWADCAYEDFQGMWEALDALADLAQAWRAVDGNVEQRLGDWIKEQTALNYSPKDDGLRQLRLHKFQFEGHPWDRTPHIKLGDHTKPNKVGRIYFAIDNDGRRWIVDHVGLKLHGL